MNIQQDTAKKNHELFRQEASRRFMLHVQAVLSAKPILNLTRSHNVRVYPKPVAGSQFLWGTTHVKISQLVASLQTSRQQVVFARACYKLSTSLEEAVSNL